MSTALLEPPVTTESVPDETPSLGASFTAWAIDDLTFESPPPVYIKSPGLEWTSVGTVDLPLDPYKLLGSFYYGSPARYTASKPVELSRLLRDAAARIEIFGWTQGTMRDELGRLCAFGALRMAGASDWDLEAINQVACKRLAEMGEIDPFAGRACTSVPRWNDAPGRTAAQVTGLLRAVADAYDAEAAGGTQGCPCGAPGCRYPERVSVSV